MEHIPVLVDEVVRYLEPQRGGLFVDVTVGLGGHAERLLGYPDVRLLGVDRDAEALARAARRLAPFGDRVRFAEGCFDELGRFLDADERPAGVLADLGVSSLQLETAQRGFSFRRDGPLDMRMGRGKLTAKEIVNRYPEAELKRIFQEYGEERRARSIARAIEAARREAPIETTAELADLVRRTKGGYGRRNERIDPATRVFQALRIEVNQELAALPRMIDEAARLMEQDGRLVVISYHSLEDRIVKNRLRDLARGQIDEVTGRPHAETQIIEVLTKKPVRPSADEVATNPRSRSARLRAGRRL